jgi:hypothetical protein
MSFDGGESWTNVASLDDSNEEGVRVHYPTIMQAGQRLLVVYSRFYLGRGQGMTSLEQGIVLQEVSLATLRDLPQLALDSPKHVTAPMSLSNKSSESGKADTKADMKLEALQKVVDHFLKAQNAVTLRRYQQGSWHSTVNAIIAR